MKHIIILYLSFLFATYTYAQKQTFDQIRHKEHVGFYADIDQNMGSSLVAKDKTSTTFAPFGRIGMYYHYHLSKNLYLGGALSYGLGNFSFKYDKKFLPTSDTTYPKGAPKETRKVIVPIVEPNIEIGYLFPMGEKHLLDVRIGISAPIYLTKLHNNSEGLVSSDVMLTPAEETSFGSLENLSMNSNQNNFGNINGNLYIGYKRINYNEFTNRLGIGLLFSYSFYDKFAAVSDIKWFNISYNYETGRTSHRLSFASIGIQMSYDIF